jgi:hypothetical protein
MVSRHLLFALVVLLGITTTATAAPRKAAFAKRSIYSPSGSVFIQRVSRLGPVARERAILTEIEKGNVPLFLRDLKPVEERFRDGRGRWHRARFYVLPDYMAIGRNGDFVRIPMTPKTAQKVATRYGFVLPTPKMVDGIYADADKRLSPRPLPPGRQMVSSWTYLRHQRIIEKQLGGKREGLVAGQKKDIVITNRLAWRPNRVAIYGWHRPGGRPIQPLSLVHGNDYADYSHGVRFVDDEMELDGWRVKVEDVLKDRNLARGLSYEGPMRVTKARTGKSGGWQRPGGRS